MKKKIIIMGDKVTDVGYRPFLLGIAESLEIERFYADNTTMDGKKAVYALVDSTEEKVKGFLEMSSSKFPENAEVEKVVEEEYEGNVMRTENYYRYLSSTQLSKIANSGGRMLEKQDAMLEKQDDLKGTVEEGFNELSEKQDLMLEKQDETIGVIKDEGQKTRDALKEHLVKDIARLYEEIDEIKATLARVVEKVGA